LSHIYEFFKGEKDTLLEIRHNYITCSVKSQVTFNLENFTNDLANSIFNLNNTQPPAQQAHSAPSPIKHFLCERKNKVNYRALHLCQEIQHVTEEIIQKCKLMCKSMRKSTKAVVTKLAPVAFSPKPANPSAAPLSPHSTSSSS
jgi:hypothetical protein